MKNTKGKRKKAVVFFIASVFIAVALAPTFGTAEKTPTSEPSNDILRNNQPILQQQEIEKVQHEHHRTIDLDRGWYWKSPYPNYAPHSPGGMPDFDQKQDQWKTIEPGPNGVIDSTPGGDDIFNPTENCIAPGPNAHLETVTLIDDVAVWSFCGPVALANCFWWFDSKYADPTGIPGDGKDNFDLVEDYGAGDDHAKNNVPLLIEKLAKYLLTTSKGTTYISDMQDGIDDWLTDTGLSSKFEEKTYNKPEFDFIEEEIERSQDVILLMGYYDEILGDKIVDQQQPAFNLNDNLNTATWWDYQSFVPSVNRLDAIQVYLVSNGPACDVKINVYNTPQGAPIGTSILNPGNLPVPTWIQFHFVPPITLTPGSTYYFDVLEVQTPDQFHYEWFYLNSAGAYPSGQGWLDSAPASPTGPFDWTFKTEYYDPDVARVGGHYVTCAGVNSEELMIAFSDPCWDIQNPTADYTKHNDPQYVSHDLYDVGIGCPIPGYDYKWWIIDYPASCDYTIVEQAVIICPFNSPPEKPLKPTGTANGKIKTTYTYSSSTTDIDGDQLYYKFDWGDGTDSGWIGPNASGVTVSASHKWTTKGSYSVKVKAKDTSGAESNWSDPLPVTMPKDSSYPFNGLIMQILKHILERYPSAFPLIRQLLGY